MTNEPIAWMVYTLDGKSVCVTDNPTDFTPEHRALPLYTSQPASKPWVGLTDEEIKRMAAPWFLSMYWSLCNTFARAVEANLREKNA